MKLAITRFISTTTRIFIAVALVGSSVVYGGSTYTTAPPPVFWNIFHADVKNNTVILKWIVTEYNNKSFHIQQSQNGNDWRDIDSISSKNGALTLDEYTYKHINKQGGRQYYRIMQTDIDEMKTGYSEVITVMIRNEKQNVIKQTISFSPNPATDQVRIINNEEKDVFYSGAKIFDLTGKMVAEQKLEGHTNTVNVSRLPTGIYLIRAECSDGSSFSQKIVKQ